MAPGQQQQTPWGRQFDDGLRGKHQLSASTKAALESEMPALKKPIRSTLEHGTTRNRQSSPAQESLAAARVAQTHERPLPSADNRRGPSNFSIIRPSPDDDVFGVESQGFGDQGRGGRSLYFHTLPTGGFRRRADAETPCPPARMVDRTSAVTRNQTHFLLQPNHQVAENAEHEQDQRALFGTLPPPPCPLVMSLLVTRPNRMDLRKKLQTSMRDFSGARFDPAIVVLDMMHINTWAIREVISLFAQIGALHQAADSALLEQQNLVPDMTTGCSVADLIQFRIFGENEDSVITGRDYILSFFMELKAMGINLFRAG